MSSALNILAAFFETSVIALETESPKPSKLGEDLRTPEEGGSGGL